MPSSSSITSFILKKTRILIENDCSYNLAGVYACNENDCLSIAKTHFKSLNEYSSPETPTVSFSVLQAHWRGILSKTLDKNLKFTIFKAVSGHECVGIGWAGINQIVKGPFAQYQGEFKLLHVIKKAQRNKIGTLLMSSLAGNLYSFGIENAYAIIQDNTTAIMFAEAMGGKLIDRLDHDLLVFVWDDLIPLIQTKI